MIRSRIQKQIPKRLSHYTTIKALKSILSDEGGKGICLRAFSNKHKNDDQEIKMGEYMLKRVLKVLPTNTSLLNRFRGYENTASVSFMEGEVNQHMLDEYGHFRLEFDLRDVGVGVLSRGLVDCEYVAEDQLEEYADEYCELISNTFNSIPLLQKRYGKISAPPINKLTDFIMMELDIMAKVVSLKEEKWKQEKEWRIIQELKPDEKIKYHDGKPYIEYYLEKKYLSGITIICTSENLNKAQIDANEIADYIKDRGYKSSVMIEVFDGADNLISQ